MSRSAILILDDTLDHRFVLRRILQSADYTVVEASTPVEALHHAQSRSIDLLLAALSLPEQPSWEALRRLKAQPALLHIPLLGATVYTTLLGSSRLRDIGCVDCIPKPFDIDDLLRRVAQWITPSKRLPQRPQRSQRDELLQSTGYRPVLSVAEGLQIVPA
jgi:two-component system cell cycle response regulator DivK